MYHVPDSSPNKSQTLGQYRVGVSFNPSANPLVDKVKQQTADIIDLIANINTFDIASMDTAVGYYEIAAMLAVKAITKEAPPDDLLVELGLKARSPKVAAN